MHRQKQNLFQLEHLDSKASDAITQKLSKQGLLEIQDCFELFMTMAASLQVHLYQPSQDVWTLDVLVTSKNKIQCYMQYHALDNVTPYVHHKHHKKSYTLLAMV